MKRALIIGIGGQDGGYAAELLLDKGYQVTGTRRPEAIDEGPSAIGGSRVDIMPLDLRDAGAIVRTLEAAVPDEMYNFAALTSGADMFADPVEIGDINGLAVARILEAIRQVCPDTRFLQASSSELFGDAVDSPQSETTVMRPRTPYGAAKLYAHDMVRIYRERFGIFACSAILFNHESPRRDQRFVTRKVTSAAARIALGLQDRLPMGNLDAVRDWGFAGDTVRAAWLMLQAERADDYVVATGVGHSVRDLCQRSFSTAGLDYRDHIDISAAVYRTAEPAPLIGNATKMRRELGWFPSVDFDALISLMVQNDLAIARRELLTSESNSE